MSNEANSKVDPEMFGFSERRVASRNERPGNLAFDDRGNAQYAWHDDRMMEEGEHADSRRMRALTVPNLVLMDDDPPPGKKVSLNKSGARIGYNPYDSGLLQKPGFKKTRNLRALSKWIEARKRPADQEED